MIDWIRSWNPDHWGALGQWVGAVVTCWAVIVTLRLARKSGVPKVKVSQEYGYVMTDFDGNQSLITMKNKDGGPLPLDVVLSEPLLVFSATNAGPIPVKVTYSYIKRPFNFYKFIRREKLLEIHPIGFYKSKLPRYLQPLEDVQYYIPTSNIADQLFDEGYRGNVRIKIVFGDVLGNLYQLKFNFDVDHWKKNS